MFTMGEALSAFLGALQNEIETVQREDVVLDFKLEKCLSAGRPRVYYGTVDDELHLPDGASIKIEDINSNSFPAEIVTSDDFGVVIAAERVLQLDRVYKMKYNLAWILQALYDWLGSIDPGVSRPIALGILQSGHSFKPQKYPMREPAISRSLNEYQVAAIHHTLQNSLTFIWGPPGTGKSRTLSELIVTLLSTGKTVLFVSQSNVAVDVVARQVINHEHEVIRKYKREGLLLRSGYPQLEPYEQWDDVLPYSIVLRDDSKLASHLENLNRERIALLEKLQAGTDVKEDIRKISLEIQQIQGMVRKKVAELEGRAPFVATTLAKVAVTRAINSREFDAVIVDEASMLSVPSVFAALTLASQHGVVAGDFLQLQPIHRSQHARVKRWLGQSVFKSAGIQEAVLNGQEDLRLVILKRQYRMSEEISGMVNALFYGGVLEDAPKEQRPTLPLDDLFNNSRLLFIDVSGLSQCSKAPGTESRLNPRLASVSAGLARRYLDSGIPVGIITPYRAQAQEIRKHFSDEELREQDGVKISTVHKFQGSEREIIIFEVPDAFPQKRPSVLVSGSKDSFIRENSPSLPLVNVALTRAKSQVVVLADRDYLRSRLTDSSVLLTGIEYIGEKGGVISSSEHKIAPKRTLSHDCIKTTQESSPKLDVAKAYNYLKCSKCGSMLVVKWSKKTRGFFLACSAYPECRHAQSLTDNDLVTILSILQPNCSNCSGLIWGEMRRGWPVLVCTQCGTRLTRGQITQALSISS